MTQRAHQLKINAKRPILSDPALGAIPPVRGPQAGPMLRACTEVAKRVRL